MRFSRHGADGRRSISPAERVYESASSGILPGRGNRNMMMALLRLKARADRARGLRDRYRIRLLLLACVRFV